MGGGGGEYAVGYVGVDAPNYVNAGGGALRMQICLCGGMAGTDEALGHRPDGGKQGEPKGKDERR